MLLFAPFLPQVEFLPFGCVPLHFADHEAQYFDEIVDYGTVGVRLAEADINSLPQAVERAVGRIESLREQALCACQATLTPIGLPSMDAHFQVLRTRPEFTRAADRHGSFATLMVRRAPPAAAAALRWDAGGDVVHSRSQSSEQKRAVRLGKKVPAPERQTRLACPFYWRRRRTQALLQGRLDAAAEGGAEADNSSREERPPLAPELQQQQADPAEGPWDRDALAEQTLRQRRRGFAVPPCELAAAGEAPEFHMLDP